MQRVIKAQEIPEPAFQIRPKLLYRVKVRRIWRQKQQLHAVSVSHFTQLFLGMKTCVVHNNRVPRRHDREHIKLEPVHKKPLIRCVTIGFGRENRVTALGGNHVGSSESASAPDIFNPHSAQRATEFALIEFMAAALIDINTLFFRDFRNFF